MVIKYALRPIAAADLTLALRRARPIARLSLHFVEARAKNLQRPRFVFMLRFLILLDDDKSGRQMSDPHSAVRCVDRLTTGPARTEDIDPQVLFVDPDVNFFGFREHRDGGGRRMNAPTRLGIRHSLDAVHTAFEFKTRENVPPANQRASLLVSTKSRLGNIEHLKPPPSQHSISLVHAE